MGKRLRRQGRRSAQPKRRLAAPKKALHGLRRPSRRPLFQVRSKKQRLRLRSKNGKCGEPRQKRGRKPGRLSRQRRRRQLSKRRLSLQSHLHCKLPKLKQPKL